MSTPTDPAPEVETPLTEEYIRRYGTVSMATHARTKERRAILAETALAAAQAKGEQVDGFEYFTIDGIEGYLIRADDARILIVQRNEALRQLKELGEELEEATVEHAIADNALAAAQQRCGELETAMRQLSIDFRTLAKHYGNHNPEEWCGYTQAQKALRATQPSTEPEV